jgi:hypothetical protein
MGKVGIACLTSCDWSQCKAASDRHHCQKHDNGDGEDDSSNDDDDDDDDDDRAEPYTSERIDLLRGGYKMLSTPATLFRFNFNDMQASLYLKVGFISLKSAHVAGVNN